MADLLGRLALLGPPERALFDTGAAILGIAFLVKAGSWPLNFWLPGSYSVAIAPVAAAFAMLTKVGVYAVLRIGTLLGEDDAAAAMLGPILFYLGYATLLAGTIGALAARQLSPARELFRHRFLRTVAGHARHRQRSAYAARAVLLRDVGGDHVYLFPFDGHDGPNPCGIGGARERAERNCSRIPDAGLRRFRRARAAALRYERGGRRRHPRGNGLLRPDVRLLRATRGRPTAAAELRRQVRAAPRRVRFGAQRSGFSSDMAAHRRYPRHRTRAGNRAHANRHSVVLGKRRSRTPRLRVLEAAPVAVLVLLSLALSAMSGSAMRFFEAAARSLHAPEVYTRIVLSTPGADQPSGGQAR